jgi:thiamine-monophosphate kinase
MSTGALGEFELIARLTRDLESRADVLLGVGDDAALLRPPSGELLVATCDAQVAGQHFTLAASSAEEIGHKALAVNLSDLAATGAAPLWALVSLHLPRGLALETLDGIYAGIRALARRFDVAIVGGNITATEGPLAVDVTMLGACPPGRVLTRAGGRPGHALLLIGALGAAAAGVLAEAHPTELASLAPALRARAHQAHCAPEPLVLEGQVLAATGTTSALIDVSDGLAGDLGHICERSQVGAVIEAAALPIDPAAAAIARVLDRDPLDLALHGGEDYALLGSVPQEAIEHTLSALRAAGSAATIIGALTEPADGLRLRRAEGREIALEPRGWDHLLDHP